MKETSTFLVHIKNHEDRKTTPRQECFCARSIGEGFNMVIIMDCQPILGICAQDAILFQQV
jgi:hypothetical protein